MRQKLSACVIVKNEAKNLHRWLSSMQQVADEMIVVDTGSTDETVAIARAAGARVYDFPWRGDFAAAKNFALGQAHGHWILFLDADEYFSRESLPHVRERIEALAPDPRVLGILCPLVNIDADNHDRRMTSLLQVRIFRHIPRLRYEGCVHEVLTLPKGKGLVLAPDITIYHTGYSTSIIQKKLRRDLKLLEKRVREQGPEPMDDRYFMDIYYGLGEHDQAMRFARKILAKENLDPALRARAYETLVSALLAVHAPAEEIASCFAAARHACPQAAEFPLMQGLYAYETGDFLTAQRALQEGLALHSTYRKEKPEDAMDNAARLLPEACWRLGTLEWRVGRVEEACAFFREGLRRFRYHRGLLCSLYDGLRALGRDDAAIIEVFSALYGKGDEAFLAETLARHGGGKVYLFYARRAGRRETPGLDYLAAGRADAAAALAAARLKGIGRLVRQAEAAGVPEAAELLPLLPENPDDKKEGRNDG